MRLPQCQHDLMNVSDCVNQQTLVATNWLLQFRSSGRTAEYRHWNLLAVWSDSDDII